MLSRRRASTRGACLTEHDLTDQQGAGRGIPAGNQGTPSLRPTLRSSRSESMLSLKRFSRSFRPLSAYSEDVRRPSLPASLKDGKTRTIGTSYSETSSEHPPPLHIATRPRTAGAPKTVAGVEVPTHYTSSTKSAFLESTRPSIVVEDFDKARRRDAADIRPSTAGGATARQTIPRLDFSSGFGDGFDMPMADVSLARRVPSTLTLGSRHTRRGSNSSIGTMDTTVLKSPAVDSFNIPDRALSAIRRPSRLRSEPLTSEDAPSLLPALPIRSSSRSWKPSQHSPDTSEFLSPFPHLGPERVLGLNKVGVPDTPRLISSFPLPGVRKSPTKEETAAELCPESPVIGSLSTRPAPTLDWSWLNLSQESSESSGEASDDQDLEGYNDDRAPS